MFQATPTAQLPFSEARNSPVALKISRLHSFTQTRFLIKLLIKERPQYFEPLCVTFHDVNFSTIGVLFILLKTSFYWMLVRGKGGHLTKGMVDQGWILWNVLHPMPNFYATESFSKVGPRASTLWRRARYQFIKSTLG